jgi:hypothetical protein
MRLPENAKEQLSGSHFFKWFGEKASMGLFLTQPACYNAIDIG